MVGDNHTIGKDYTVLTLRQFTVQRLLIRKMEISRLGNLTNMAHVLTGVNGGKRISLRLLKIN